MGLDAFKIFKKYLKSKSNQSDWDSLDPNI